LEGERRDPESGAKGDLRQPEGDPVSEPKKYHEGDPVGEPKRYHEGI